jgi:ribosomal protein L29
MADKKIDKKTAKEAEIINNLPLTEQLAKKKAELLVAKQGLGSTLQNPRIIKYIKKDIARIMTKINATKGDK